MPVPSPRSKLLPARGNYADLAANVAELLDGEICYAIDQDQYYQKEGSVLVSVGATKAQGALAATALQDAPSNGSEYVRKDGQWAISSGGSGGGGITDAPVDGNQYARQDAGWTQIVGGGSGPASTDELPEGSANKYFPEAPLDGSEYVRKNGTWSVATAGDGGGGSTQPTVTWTLTANGNVSYLFAGPGFLAPTPNPALTLVRGQTYVFDNVSGAHPFQIESSGSAYNDGVVNNNVVGTVTFTVPFSAPSELTYVCTAHAAMSGDIAVLDAAPDVSAPVDSVNGQTGAVSLGVTDLTDYADDGNAISDGSVLTYDSDAGKFTPVAPGGGSVTSYGPFNASSFHTFDSTDASAASSDLQDWTGPVASDVVKIGAGACDGRPTNSGCEVRGSYGDDQILQGDPFTIAFWYRHDNVTSGGVGHYIIGSTKAGVNTPSGLNIKILTNDFGLPQEDVDNGIGVNTMALINGSGNSGFLVAAPGHNSFDDQWHHYVFSHDGNGLYRHFLDGALVYTKDKGSAENFTDAGIYGSFGTEFTLMGCRDDSCRNYGILDNFGVWRNEDWTAGLTFIPSEAQETPTNTALTFSIADPIGATTDLSDFATVPASAGQVPVSDGTKYVPTSLNLTTDLVSLTDVAVTSPADGDALTYDAASGTWINSAGGGGGGGGSVDALSDTAITAPVLGEALTWNGTEWVNLKPLAAGVSKTVTAAQITACHDFEEYGTTSSGVVNADDWTEGQSDSFYDAGPFSENVLDHSETVPSSPGFSGTWNANDEAIFIEFWYKHDGTETTQGERQHIFGIGSSSDASANGEAGFLIQHCFETYDLAGGSTYGPWGFWGEDALILFDAANNDSAICGTKTKPVADGQWHHYVFCQEPASNSAASGDAASGVFKCFVDGLQVDEFDRTSADVETGRTGPIDSNEGGTLDTYYFAALKDGTKATRGQVDNFYAVAGSDVYPYAVGHTAVDAYQGTMNVDRTFFTPEKCGNSTALGDFSAAKPLIGQVPMWTGTKREGNYYTGFTYESEYRPAYVARIAEYYTGEYAYGYPYSSSADMGTSQSPGAMVVDSFNNKIAIYTGPYDFDSGSGGWVEFSTNQIFGA